MLPCGRRSVRSLPRLDLDPSQAYSKDRQEIRVQLMTPVSQLAKFRGLRELMV